MLKNYLLTALRNLQRNKLTAMINIVGLALGIVTCLFIFTYVKDELSFDRHHANAERIYRVNSNITDENVDDKFALTAFNAIPVITGQFTDVEAGVRLFPVGRQAVKVEEKEFLVENIFFADTTFFSVFDVPFLKGDPATALSQPNSIVLSEKNAARIFGAKDPLGEMVQFKKNTYKVTGVYDNSRHNTVLDFEGLLSMNTLDKERRDLIFGNDWYKINTYSFVLLRPGVDASSFETRLTAYIKKHIEPWIKQNELRSSLEYYLEPLTGLRFSENAQYDPVKKTRKAYIYIFSITGILILLIAVFNYINLATAAATRRSREVAVRKVNGAGRKELMVQFMGESLLTVIISSMLALLFLELLLPFFNEVAGKAFSFTAILEAGTLSVCVIGLFLTLAGGAYPALYLSSFTPLEILRNSSTQGSNGTLRKVLVTLQFSISVVMIIGTWIIYSQLNFMIEKDPGYKKENLVALSIPATQDSLSLTKIEAFRNELASMPAVKATSKAAHLPGKAVGRLLYFFEGKDGMQEKPMSSLFADYEFLQMMKIPLVKGRYFDKNIPTDARSYIMNEAAVKWLGWEDPIGKKMEMGLGYDGEVIGVVKNFNFESLHNSVQPLVILISNPAAPPIYLVAELENSTPGQLDVIRSKWQELFPVYPFEYFFIEDNIKELYLTESNMFSIFSYFSSIAIFISCMGLFALAAFVSQQRTKEIGIRKVLGASVNNILLLINRDFLWLVLIAIVVAWPVAWYGLSSWLDNFAFRINISPLIFIASGLFAIMISILIVSVHAFKTANTNPVTSLRYE